MLDHFIEPPLYISLILDIGNYLVFFILFAIAREKELINTNLFALSGVLLLSPFFVNGFLISWTQLPDQTKYLRMAQEIRADFPFLANTNYCDGSIINYGESREDCTYKTNFFDDEYKTKLPSLIFALSPLLSIESFKSIGFVNRALFIGTIVFLITRNYIPLYVKIFAIFSPSIIIYSSVSLRDSLVLVALIWSLYFFFKKKYILLILASLFLYIIKPQNLMIIFVLFYLIILLQNVKYKKFKVFHILLTIILIPTMVFFSDFVLEVVNEVKYGLFIEQNGFYNSVTGAEGFTPLVYSPELPFYILRSAISFLLSPMQNLSSSFHIIVFIEAIAIYALLFKNFFQDLHKKGTRTIAFIWIFIFFFNTSVYGLFIINDGAISRYRIVMLFFMLIGYELHKAHYRNKHKLKKL